MAKRSFARKEGTSPSGLRRNKGQKLPDRKEERVSILCFIKFNLKKIGLPLAGRNKIWIQQEDPEIETYK